MGGTRKAQRIASSCGFRFATRAVPTVKTHVIRQSFDQAMIDVTAESATPLLPLTSLLTLLDCGALRACPLRLG